MSITEDELAIRRLAAAYSDAVNRGDLDAMVAVYAPDGVLIPFAGQEYKGRDAIRKVVGESIGRFEYIFQMTHSGMVQVNGDCASCRWWISEISYLGDGKAKHFLGLYQDKVARTEEGWRFTCRRLDPTFLGNITMDGKQYARPTYHEELWP